MTTEMFGKTLISSDPSDLTSNYVVDLATQKESIGKINFYPDTAQFIVSSESLETNDLINQDLFKIPREGKQLSI